MQSPATIPTQVSNTIPASAPIAPHPSTPPSVSQSSPSITSEPVISKTAPLEVPQPNSTIVEETVRLEPETIDLSPLSTHPAAKLNLAEPIRPLTPSVPIRIAAPSIRAMPPRPPKTHRHIQTQDKNSSQKRRKKTS